MKGTDLTMSNEPKDPPAKSKSVQSSAKESEPLDEVSREITEHRSMLADIQEDVAQVIASRGADMILLNYLVSFLDDSGVMSRHDFIAFLQAKLAQAEDEQMFDASVRGNLRSQIDALRAKPLARN
jgi:hypothetical protein